MEENDGVRTRLTHSHEVANLARSIGSRVHKRSIFLKNENLYETIQPMITAIGLAHDLGNPPFGHQGEVAISRWFEVRKSWIFTKLSNDGVDLQKAVPEKQRNEFLSFDGNPQTIRLVTRLQTSVSHVGLNLTASTLCALLKYPIGAANKADGNAVTKKFGYFESESAIIEWARNKTGLEEYQRHPLTWIMEACDDIAYSVLDLDDTMKKGVVSPDDILGIMKLKLNNRKVFDKIRASFDKTEALSLRPEIVRDIKINYLRAHLIESLVVEVTQNYLQNESDIFSYSCSNPLLEKSELCNELKQYAKQFAFSNPAVLKMEALGSYAIQGIMDFIWKSITNRSKFENILSSRSNAEDKYIFSLISPNYLEDAVRVDPERESIGTRYRELRLLTDMISGMTDTFTIKLWDQIRGWAR